MKENTCKDVIYIAYVQLSVYTYIQTICLQVSKYGIT